MISQDLLCLLCCPACRRELTLSAESDSIECGCGKRYPIKNGVPVLLAGNSAAGYDDLYSQIAFDASPFGYSREYATWRKGQINRQIAQYLIDGSVLDDGGGYGYLKEYLDSSRHRYYNVDCSYEILKYDRSKLLAVGEGEALPFKDGAFDNVVSGDVLEHVRDKRRYLEEAWRVLKPGGVFVVNTPREGWRSSYARSIWFWIPYLSDAWARIKNRLAKKKTRSAINVPEGVVDIPSEENWLRGQLEKMGYEILVQKRTDNHLFGFTHSYWRKFADAFIDARKYGHCVFVACRKR